MIQKQPPASHGFILIGVSGGGVYWVPRMSNPARSAHEPNNRSPAPIGPRDPEIVLLPCMVYLLDNGLERGRLNSTP